MTYNITLVLKNGEYNSIKCYNAKERNLELQSILSEYDNDDIEYLDYDKEYVSGDRLLGKIIIDNTKSLSQIFEENGVKPLKESTDEYIHEHILDSMVFKMWDEFYNVELYNDEFLNNCYSELFKFDRENRWIMMQESDIDYDIWMQAFNEHKIISKLIAKIFAYIIEPFGYIENLYKPYTSKEIACYEKKWGC